MATNPVFSETPAEPNADEVNFELLVGDDKKYKTADDLAKAKAHADNFIEQLKSEAAALRAKNETLEDVVKNTSKPPVNPEPNPQIAVVPPNPAQEDISELIRKEVEALSQTDRIRKNQADAADRMVEVYGSTEKANAAIRTKAIALGVSVQWLQDTAGRSPDAFAATMGLDTRQTPQSSPAPRNDAVLRPTAKPSTGRGKAYYENLRKTDYNAWASSANQKEMLKEAESQGDAFFD